MFNLTKKLLGCMGLTLFAISTCATEATNFTTTTITGTTLTGTFEQTTYHLNWYMRWFDQYGAPQNFFSLNDTIRNGIAYMPKTLFGSPTTVYTTYFGMDLPDIIDADDVRLSIMAKNSYASGAIPSRDLHLVLIGTEGKAEVNFLDNLAMIRYTLLGAGDTIVYREGTLIQGFNNFGNAAIKVHNNTVSAIIGGTVVKTIAFSGSLGKLVNIGIDFRGSASVDELALYEGGVERMRETFNVTGTTTAKLVVYTGTLFSGGTTGIAMTGPVITGMLTVQAPDYGFNPYAKELKGQYTQDQIEYLNMIALKKRQQAQIAACNKAETEYNQASQIKVYSFQLLGQIEKKYVSACNIPNVVVIIPKDAADPIDLTNGSMTYSQTLMSLVGRGTPFSFDINYASNITHDSPVGYGFNHNWDIFLGIDEDDGQLYYSDGSGFPILMPEDPQAPGTWYQEQLGARLFVNTAREFELHYSDGTELVFKKITSLDQTSYRPYIMTDAVGNATSLTWNADDQLEKVVDSAGHIINFTYNAQGKITQVQEGSRQVNLAYYQAGDALGTGNDLKRITITHGTESKTTEFTYSVGQSQEHLNHNMLTLVDSKGQTYVSNTYDSNDAVTQQIYGGDTYRYTYTRDSQGAITQVAVINGRGKHTRYTFNNQGNVVERSRTTDAGTLETFTMDYNALGQLTDYTYPDGKTVHYTYDALSRLDSMRVSHGALSQTTSYSYEGDSPSLNQTILPNGQVINYDYDQLGQLISTTFSQVNNGTTTVDLTTKYDYNIYGQVISIRDPEGTITSFGYDQSGLLETISKGGHTMTMVHDADGSITQMTDAEGNSFAFDYNRFYQLLQSTSAEGIVQQSSYDLTNNTTSSSTQIGNASVDSTMTYDVLDRLISMTTEQSASTGQHYQWTYDPHDLIKTMTAPNGSLVSYTYDHNDNVVSQTITDGTTSKVYQYVYNVNGELVSATAPNGSQSQRIRDGLGRVVEMRDALGTRTLVTYNNQNLPSQVRIMNSAGVTLKKTEYEYNSIGWLLTQRVFTLQGTQRNQSAGQAINYTLSQATNYETRYTYNKRGQIKTTTDPKGFVTQLSYDTKGRLSQARDALSNTMTYTYDGRDLVTKKRITSATNGTIYDTRYFYDHDARLVKTINNDGKYKTFVYNDLNQIVRIRDENGRRTDMTYDYQGNTLSQTQYLITSGGTTSLTTNYRYDIMNNLISMTDAEGNTSRFVYDGLNRIIEEIYPDGRRNTFSYDVMDNVIQASDPNGTVVYNNYDQLNRLVARNINPASGVGGVTQESYSYDAIGRLISGTDSMNQAINFSYDGLDRVIKERNNGKNLHYEYDANSNLSTVIYPSTKQLTREFDQLNRLTTMDWAAYGQTINLMDNDYDSLFLLETSFGNQAKTTYAYDNLMRVSSINHYQSLHPMHNNAGQVIEQLDYTYDKVSNVLGDGQRSYTLDSVYRLTDSLYPPNQAAAIKKEKFNYDKVGNRTQFESWVEKAHGNSAMNTNPTQVAANPLVINQDLVAANGNSAKVTVCHNGQALEVNQNALASHLAHGDTQGACAPSSPVTGSTGPTPGNGTTSGNVGNGNSNGNGGNTNNNGNGNNNNGTSSGTTTSGTAQPGGPTYGGAGGTPGMLTFQGTTTYNVNNLNQYTNVTYPRNGSQTETVNFVYDDNGNLLQDDKREYQYDYRNRLIKATNLQNHEIITFKYDILNRRTQKTDRSKSWKWVYSFQDVAEEDWYMNASMTAGAIKVREFVYGNGMDDLVYMEQNKPLTYQDEQEEEGYTEVYTGGGFNTAVKRYFFQKDLAGSTKIVSDIKGKVIEMYAYDSFGRIYERSGISANYRPFQTSRVNHNRFFTNREYDTDLQLYYYRARWYSPALGRFMSRDPLGYSEGVNLYAYVGNNPTTFTDPWGLKEKSMVQYADFNGARIQDRREYFDASRSPMGALNAVGNIGVFAKNTGRSIWNGGVDIAEYGTDSVMRGYNEGAGVAAGRIGNDASLVGNALYNGAVNKTWQQKKDFTYQALTNIETYENLGGLLIPGVGVTKLGKLNTLGKVTSKVDNVVVDSIAVQNNLQRFINKIPANSKDSVQIEKTLDGTTIFTANSPGKVPGSYAIYQKTVDQNGNTIDYLKTTIDPQGNLVHAKNKINH